MDLLNSIISRINHTIASLRDFRTPRHIVVFESDDWGSIRMSNKKDWNSLLRMGYAVDKRPYERFDTLESSEDLEALFDVLCKYKDCRGNHPVITANMLMANPDFERIERSCYQDYYYEPIANTYKRYFGNSKVLDVMRQGYEGGLFMPQNHGREHFNVEQWMKALRNNDEDTITAFQYRMCGIAPKGNPKKGNQLMNALRASNEEEQLKIETIVSEGLDMFENLWGFKSHTFVAPCYCWNGYTEKTLAEKGVKLIQTSRTNKATYQRSQKFYYSGQNNSNGQVYSIRNCAFEPATDKDKLTVEALIKGVDKVFLRHKIAVFSTHRINFVGGINEHNRNNNLLLFDRFLKALLKKYPTVEFLSSDELIKLL